MRALLTPSQVSERLNTPVRSLERWRLHGDGPPFVRLGRRIGYPADELDVWIAARTFRSRADELARQKEAQ